MRKILAFLVILVCMTSSFAQPASEMTEYKGITLATGATITKEALLKEDRTVSVEDYGAVALEKRAPGDTDTHAIENTEAFNTAIDELAAAGGGTLVVPEGTFRTYTIELESGVNILLEEGSVIQAARTRTFDRQGNMTGEAEDFHADGTPGNYLQPEVNIYAGLQDGGHTYFANSLFYAADKKDIMIYGSGLVDGSQMGDDDVLIQVLSGSDPGNPSSRTDSPETWFGNKGIALLRCENVVLEGFDMLNCGHFAIINEGTRNMLVDGLTVDTNRDALNIDCGQDVTIVNSHFNSLTDDAIVFKASYGAGIFMPVHNCLVEDCIVSGYDAGSVLAGTYTTDKQVATDMCGPTARVKFGTESTCGYDTVTIRNVRFERSRGFCMEAVDGSPIHDIALIDCTMDTVSSSPVFIRVGNRGRYPVTGNSTDTALSAQDNVRLTNTGWILPQNDGQGGYSWSEYPAKAYFPAYSYDREGATMSNGITVQVVDQDEPVLYNEANYVLEDGQYYALKWEDGGYVADYDKPLDEADLAAYGDAVGYSGLASAYNILIEGLSVTNADPRYPIILAGLVDSQIHDVVFEDVSVEYRGGLRMQDAVEQQQLTTDWNYTQYMTAPSVQTLPWLVNTFFAKNSALLPRVVWDAQSSSWVDNPYNVPEMPEQYPEPSNFGILPSYGLYARHARNISFNNVRIGWVVEDGRHAIVLDDCQSVEFSGLELDVADSVAAVALVENAYKRPTGFEYVPEQPYHATSCEDITGLEGFDVVTVSVDAPEPGTPSDSLYPYPTVADTASGYGYGENVWTVDGVDYDLPVTVHRPFFEPIADVVVEEGESVEVTVTARNPAAERDGERNQAASDATLSYSASGLPEGASFDPTTRTLVWNDAVKGNYQVTFTVDDGVVPVSADMEIEVL